MAVAPAGDRGGDAGREPATTAVPRLLQLCGAPPGRLAVHDVALPHRRHHCVDRHRGRDGGGPLLGLRGGCGNGPGAPERCRGHRGGRRTRGRRRIAGAGSRSCGDPDAATSTSSMQSSSTTRAPSSTATHWRSAFARYGSRGRNSSSTATLLLQGFRHARGPGRPWPGSRRRRDGARLLTPEMGRRQLVPDLALPLRRGGPGACRPTGHRRDRRDGGGRAQPRRRGWHVPRRTEDDVLRGDDQFRHAASAPPGDRGAHRPGQEPPVRGRCGASPTSPSPTPRPPGCTSSPCSWQPGRRTRAGPSASST